MRRGRGWPGVNKENALIAFPLAKAIGQCNMNFGLALIRYNGELMTEVTGGEMLEGAKFPKSERGFTLVIAFSPLGSREGITKHEM